MDIGTGGVKLFVRALTVAVYSINGDLIFCFFLVLWAILERRFKMQASHTARPATARFFTARIFDCSIF